MLRVYKLTGPYWSRDIRYSVVYAKYRYRYSLLYAK